MKQDKIHDALDRLDEDLVGSVTALREKRRARSRRLRWGALAACLCAAVLAVFVPLFRSTPHAIAAENLMKGVNANPVAAAADLRENSAAVTDFGVRLFQNSMEEGESSLISPLSVLCALAMTANGAEGETLAQMETALGLDVGTLNHWLHTYMAQLPQGDQYKLSLANSVWFTDDESFTANRDFLQTNADYYGADIYQAPFDDTTVKDINNWVNDNTDGMIPGILNEIPEEAVMYLINALAFDARWQTIYRETQVQTRTFTTEDGREQAVELMFSDERLYLEDENATGFIKYYNGKKYAFAALLPNEGVTVADYVDTLTGEHLQNLLSDPEETTVYAAIPKFKTETSVELSEVLKAMGMTDAFDWRVSDFSAMGFSQNGPLFISQVLHKTYIAVDEQGTRAGAVTAVAAEGASEPMDVKTVYLDRPFVYMLIDCETNTPFFLGTMMDPAL